MNVKFKFLGESQSEPLEERVVTILPHHKALRAKHFPEIHAMLSKAYEKAGGLVGGGMSSPEDMHKSIPMVKAIRRQGKIVGAVCYKDKHGRKAVAMGSDGSTEGRSGVAHIRAEDAKLQRSWGEVSDRALTFTRKTMDIKPHLIHPSEVQKLMPNDKITFPVSKDDPEVQQHPDLHDHFYQREIGGKLKTKIAYGKPGNRIVTPPGAKTESVTEAKKKTVRFKFWGDDKAAKRQGSMMGNCESAVPVEQWLVKESSESYEDFITRLDEAEPATTAPTAPEKPKRGLRAVPAKPEPHAHAGKAFYQSGKDLPTQYHGGPVQVRHVDDKKIDPQGRGSAYGRGFYTTNSKEVASRRIQTTNAWHKRTGGTLSIKKAHPSAHILKAGEKEDNSHPDLVKAVKEFSPKYAKVGDMGMGDMTWKHQVNKFAEHHNYHAIQFDFNHPAGYPEHGNHTVVWKKHDSSALVHVNSRLAVKKGFKKLGESIELDTEHCNVDSLEEAAFDTHDTASVPCLFNPGHHDDEMHRIEGSSGVASYQHCPQHRVTYVHMVGQGRFGAKPPSEESPSSAALVAHVIKAAKAKGHTLVGDIHNDKLRGVIERLGGKKVTISSRVGKLLRATSPRHRQLAFKKPKKVVEHVELNPENCTDLTEAAIKTHTVEDRACYHRSYRDTSAPDHRDEMHFVSGDQGVAHYHHCPKNKLTYVHMVGQNDGSSRNSGFNARRPQSGSNEGATLVHHIVREAKKLGHTVVAQVLNDKIRTSMERLGGTRVTPRSKLGRLVGAAGTKYRQLDLTKKKAKYSAPSVQTAFNFQKRLGEERTYQNNFRFVPSRSAPNTTHKKWKQRREEKIQKTQGAVKSNIASAGSHPMVVFKSSHPNKSHWTHEVYHAIHPSAKRPGIWQVSQFDAKTNQPIGDFESVSRESAIRSLSGEVTREHGNPYGHHHYVATPFGKKTETFEDFLATLVEKLSPGQTAYDFSSTQVNLPAHVAKAHVAFAKSAIDPADLTDKGIEDQPHVTVKYGLHHEDPTPLHNLLKGEKPISMRLGKTRVFPANEKRPESDVIVCDVHSEDLHRLNRKVADAYPHTDTYPEYHPHATVAYVKAGTGQKYADLDHPHTDAIEASSVAFSPKDGDMSEVPIGSSAD